MILEAIEDSVVQRPIVDLLQPQDFKLQVEDLFIELNEAAEVEAETITAEPTFPMIQDCYVQVLEETIEKLMGELQVTSSLLNRTKLYTMSADKWWGTASHTAIAYYFGGQLPTKETLSSCGVHHRSDYECVVRLLNIVPEHMKPAIEECLWVWKQALIETNRF